jgi:beta-galactosidase
MQIRPSILKWTTLVLRRWGERTREPRFPRRVSRPGSRVRSPHQTKAQIVAFALLAIGNAISLGAEPNGVSSESSVETIALASTPRTVADFDRDWRFSKGDFPSAPIPAFDDSAWRLLNLPHDWSIEGPFGPEFASGNGYAPGGIGWYRKHFRLEAAATNKLVAIEFDGVYDHAEVWINGHFGGGRPYGYSSFECDLTPHLKFGGGENVVAVRVDHSRFADSRWYTGSGIYRHVRLRMTERLRLAQWGTFVATPDVRQDSATVRIETSVESGADAARTFSLQSEIVAPDGTVAASVSTANRIAADTNQTVVQEVVVPNPQLWTLAAPRLYTLRSRVMVDADRLDETTTAFGIRTFRFDPDKGFFLNGAPLKLKGVCVHHEAGCLGAAVPEKVWERRLRTLKELGVNAIRTSHNPPAPEFLDLCDRLGLLVKDEAFDEFTPAKNKWVTGRNNGLPSRFGYAEDFEEWSVRDISDMVRRDRNHPSIILWSIGNEIDYANDPFSHPVLGDEYRPGNPAAENLVKHARPLIAEVKALDTTRPVTAALANVAMSDAVGLGELLDVVGYNYQEQRYPSDHAKFPKRVIFGSENGHLFGNWTVVRDHDYVAGQFLWTGIDYLGEANRWPNRGSGAGLLDLCGFKKPLAWFRQSLWSDQPMVYLCVSSGGGVRGRTRGEESWNWPSNATITVRCYTTCAEVQLTLNGKTVGTKRRADAVQGELTWEVPFAPGVLKAVGREGDKSVSEFELKTAGSASRIELLSDVNQLSADGRDICHIEFRLVDAQGVRVPDAANEVTFNLDGPAKLLGIENGDLNSPDDCKDRKHKAYRGRGLAILQSERGSGKITVTATSPALDSASVGLNSR